MQCLAGAVPGGTIVLSGDLNSHAGEVWWCVNGRNGLSDVYLSGVSWLDFSASHPLSVMNTMFEQTGVHKYTWHQGGLLSCHQTSFSLCKLGQ